MIDYYCKNGAYHIYECCDTCWNRHPEATKGFMFMMSSRYEEIIKEDFIENAVLSGFSKEQAEFLYQRVK